MIKLCKLDIVKKKSDLLLHHHPSNCSLDHIGPVQTVHTVDSEDSLLLADDSCLIHPSRGKRVITGCFHRIRTFKNSQIKKSPEMNYGLPVLQNKQGPHDKRLIYCYEVKWKIVKELLPGPFHVGDDISDRIGQYLNVLKLHTSTDKEDIRTKKKQMHCGIKRILKRYNAALISPVLVEIKRNISKLWVVV